VAAKSAGLNELEQQLVELRRQTELGKDEVCSLKEQLREVGSELSSSRAQCDGLEQSVSGGRQTRIITTSSWNVFRSIMLI